MSDKHPFVMFPSRIWQLPGITVQLLKFYEKIFQFWHQGNDCFLKNSTLMEYAGMKSESTARDAFTYFELHGEMKRIKKNGHRYIIAPEVKCSTNNFTDDNDLPDNSSNDAPSATALVTQRCSAAPPSAAALHNNINIIKQINKSFCLSDEQKKRKAENEKKHDFAKPPMASVETQSTSYNPNKPRSEKVSPLLEKYRKEQDAKTSKPTAKPANELSTGTEVPVEIPRKGHNGGQGAAIAADRGEGNPSNFRGRYGLLAACSSRLHPEEAGVAGDERTSTHTTQTG